VQHLLSNYHPDLAPLAHALRAGLESVKATPLRPAVTVPRWTTVLARVSDESRTKFLSNLDEDLDWLLDSEPAAWVKANVTDVEAFRATAAGQRARDKVGMHALYAPGTRRLIGGWLARDGWLFLFLLSSAAKSDLPQNRNAATEATWPRSWRARTTTRTTPTGGPSCTPTPWTGSCATKASPGRSSAR